MNGQDIFDILGISEREDSYTDLFVNAFKTSPVYRRRVNAVLDGFFEEPENVQIFAREEFTFPSIPLIGRRKKILPDIIMYAQDEAKLLILESKIFSGEGYMQTTEYSSDAAEKLYHERFNFNDIRYWFVTVGGIEAGSALFKALKWSDLICAAGILDDSGQPLFADDDLLVPMIALFNRAGTYKEFSELPLGDMVTFTTLLGNCSHWINKELVFKRYFASAVADVASELGLKYWFSYANNKEGKQDLCVLADPAWARGNLDDESVSLEEKKNTHNIHMEINWVEGGRLSVFMHYEMNPYASKKGSLSYSSDILTSFQTNRSHFTGNAAKELRKSKYWKPMNKWLAFGVSAEKFEDWENRPLSEIKELMGEVLREGAGIIRNTLEFESTHEAHELKIMM